MDITQDFISKINSTKVLVIAGTMGEFIVFTEIALWRNSQEGLYDGYEFVYYSNQEEIEGMMFDSFLFYGSGIDRLDVESTQIRMSIKS